MTEHDCVFCTNKAKLKVSDKYDTIDCRFCGNYNLSFNARASMRMHIETYFKDKRNIISAIMRERYELNYWHEIITFDNFDNILHTVKIPKSIQDKFDKVILYLYRKSKEFKQSININTEEYNICYGNSKQEFQRILKELGSQQLLTVGSSGINNYDCALMTKGIERAEYLNTNSAYLNQCFVAMWFHNTMNPIFNNYIIPAIEARTLDGRQIENEKAYKAIRIDMSNDYNDEMMDAIISEIRKSKFIVADFTGNRGGVYYEAGFAYGLGKPVIYTCKQAYFEKRKKRNGDVIHFDVNHKNFILWKDGKDLYSKLRNRISASIL